MKITIGSKTYADIESLKFDPSADITGTTVVVNQFSASIKTDDSIAYGDYASLYDDNDNLWAKYWVTEVEQVNEGFKDIIAQSLILLLDRYTLPAKMYSGVAVGTVLAEIFERAPKATYMLDDSFASETISGYCKEQTARERLQQVCLVIGAYIKTYFTDQIKILPVKADSVQIPLKSVFYKPTISYSDVVTSVLVRAYTFTAGTPTSADESVTVGDTTYIQTTQDFSFINDEAPSTSAENVVSITDCTLINDDNVSKILSRIAGYNFKRMQVQFDAIDTGEYQPAQEITVPVNSTGQLATGFSSECSFSFGHTQKATITLKQMDASSVQIGKKLIIIYKHGDDILGQMRYYFPSGSHYSLENVYYEGQERDGSRLTSKTVYYPENEKAEGVMGTGDVTEDEEQESIALQSNLMRIPIVNLYNGENIVYKEGDSFRLFTGSLAQYLSSSKVSYLASSKMANPEIKQLDVISVDEIQEEEYEIEQMLDEATKEKIKVKMKGLKIS